MKKELKLLNRISDILEIDRYYVVTIYKNRIVLQGNFNANLVAMMKKLNFKVDVPMYVQGERKLGEHSVEIVLT